MSPSEPPEIFVFGQFRLDRRTGGLFRCSEGGDPVLVPLGSRALDLLAVFLRRPGDLISKNEIMAAVWPDTVVEEANLAVQISGLRRVLDQDRAQGSCIQTVPGRGYRFIAAVVQSAAAELPVEPIAVENTAPGPGVRTGPAAPAHRRYVGVAFALLVAAVVGAGGAATWIEGHGWPHRDARPRLSIVVLPFANLGSDPEQEYFADAITDDLTTDLSRISGSLVIAHNTALTYRTKLVDVKQIGHDLDVHYVLEGSVRRMGDQVQVNAQLVDAESGVHVWADRFDTDRRNLVEAQSEITGRLAHTLDVELAEAAARRIEQEKRANPDAEDLAMRGWVMWLRPFSAETRQEAARLFERALEIDPHSIAAKIGAATILTSTVGLGLSRAPQLDTMRAEQLLLKVIADDANNSRAHEVLGTLRRIQNRLDESRIEFEMAVGFDRNNAHALLGLGQTLMFLGHPDAAIAPIEHSMRLNPRDPNIAFAHWSLGACDLLLGHGEKAADLLRTARAENPRVYYFQLWLAGALGLRGDIDEARTALADAVKLRPQVNSLALWNASQPWIGNSTLAALRDTTLDAGLRRAGMPNE